MKSEKFVYSITWNLMIISFGALILGIGINSVVLPHGMITGGFSGMGLLVYYYTGILSPGTWYFILNLPLFILGWKFVSKRFFFYSLYGMTFLTVIIDFISFKIPIHDSMLAALAGGAIVGAGAGIIFRSLGSAGGNDIIAVILNQKFNVRIGAFNFFFNFVLFLFSFGTLDADIVLYSMAMSFVSSQVIDYFMSIFNERKMVLIISKYQNEVAQAILKKINRGATFISGKGAYTGESKDIILTVVNNYQLKRLEEVVFNIDSDAFLITDNTFNVLGKGFTKRKKY